MDARSTAERLGPDSRANALAEAALAIATSTIDDAMAELRSIALGDRAALVEACEILRTKRGGDPRDQAIQHMAFALVRAVFTTTGDDTASPDG